MIYLDGAATLPILPCVKKEMAKVFEMEIGNASSLHSAGTRAKEMVEESRKEIARLINAEPDEIIFTSGGSESNNTVMHIFQGKRIAVSKIEHPSVIESAKEYASEFGFFPELSSPDLVSIQLANNETGLILDIPKKTGFFLHSDLTQAVSKLPVDVKKMNLDYATISAHKIGGPIGVGALYVRSGAPFRPLIFGGHQERGKRAGTYPTAQIVGFGAAARYVRKNDLCKIYNERVRKLRNLLATRILKEVPFSSLNTDLDRSLPNILNVSFRAAEGESIQLYLDLEDGIIVSTGSACASLDGRPSHVIMALKNDAEIAHSSIRFSLTPETTKEDIEEVVNVLSDVIKRLQGISTVKIKKGRK